MQNIKHTFDTHPAFLIALDHALLPSQLTKTLKWSPASLVSLRRDICLQSFDHDGNVLNFNLRNFE